MNIIGQLLELYFYVFFASILLSWVPTTPGTFFHQVKQFLRLFVDPVLAPIRRVVRPVRFGNAYMDLSPIIVLLGLQLLMGTIGR